MTARPDRDDWPGQSRATGETGRNRDSGDGVGSRPRRRERCAAALPQQALEIAAGYAFTGPALDLGALLWDGAVPAGRTDPHPAADAQPARPRRRRHRHRQDQDPPAHRRAAVRAGRAGLPRRHQGRRLRDLGARRAERQGRRSGPARSRQEWEADRVSRASSTRSAASATASPYGRRSPSFGPVLLSKVLQLNQTQEQSLGLIFHYADQKGLELVDLKDLRAVVTFLTSDEGKPELKGIGGLSTATAGVILRSLTAFEAQGMSDFFGEPEFDTSELLRHGGGRAGPGLRAGTARGAGQAAALLDVPDVAARRSLPRPAGGRRRRASRSSSSSSTRRICSSTTRRRPSWTPSRRPSG